MDDNKEQVAEHPQPAASTIAQSPLPSPAQIPSNPQTPIPAQGQTSTPSSGGKSFFTNPIFYVLLVVILVGTFAFLMMRDGTKTTSQQQDTKTVDYKKGLPLNTVTEHIPNETIGRYPLTDFTLGAGFVWPNTFEGLTVYRGLNLEPGLAVSWTNPTPTTWRIKLRKGVKFQSGDPFTAEDVKYTIDTAKASVNDKIPWPSQPYAARVSSVNIIDDYTVDLITDKPDATLLYGLFWVGMVSKAQVARDGLSKAVGAGPYKIVSIAEKEAHLVAYEGYWGGVPKVKNLNYKVVDDTGEAKKDFKNGSLDILLLNTTHNNDLSGTQYHSSSFHIGDIVYFTFDVNSDKTKYVSGVDKNPFKDLRVRKAIQLALDYNKIIKASGDNAEPVSQFVTQELVGYNPNLKSPSYDPTEAKKLLTEAGFPNGFTVAVDADQKADHPRILAEVKKELAQIGITVNANIIDTDSLYTKFFATDFSMMLTDNYPDTIDSVDFVDEIFHTVQGRHGLYNGSQYSNPQLDAQIDQGESTFDENKRIALTRNVHSLIMDQLPGIPLFTENYQTIARDDISLKPSISGVFWGFDLSGRKQLQ